jgi:aarF domain-containing kinase
MSAAFLLGRSCLRQTFRSATVHAIPQSRTFSTRRTLPQLRQFYQRPPPPRGKIALLAGASLTPAAFVQIAQGDDDDGRTSEQHMLEVSRKEINQERIPEHLRGKRKIRRRIYILIDRWIIEPIATGFRFLHLVFIFVPVILAVPAIWIGPRVPEKDGERVGTLWWYGFLVNSMERAGAAFIKVSC